jgi:type II secretory ATPase GspE/PulE/Tfp pilus assembly ATPase PilB-like protein
MHISDSPAIGLVQELLQRAVARSASDIHFESLREGLRVRFRIDGVLYDEQIIPDMYKFQITARIKVLGHLDVSEKRLPQDGKFSYVIHHRSIDFRVSTFPAQYGEKTVIRILDRSHNMLELKQLGFSEQLLSQITKLVDKSHGFFLVAGPTGSGKTTTLYSLMSYLQEPSKNIVTLEDPIEYNIDGITQGQVYPDIGFTFARGVRALLRQDPNIILIGEIRDEETARVALQAALTGHLVLSTVHTTDAANTVMRLLDMGIEPFLLNAALSGVLAQRLVRKLCLTCRMQAVLNQEQQELIKKYNISITNHYISSGCSECMQLGYKGRIGIFELLQVSSQLRRVIPDKPILEHIYTQACTDGMQPLLQDAAQKVQDGIISLSELIRVLL